ncbi:hypothetical protein WDU94_005475 [Cyamophila willieti]
MNVVQINLHHAKAASATFTKLILERNIKLALIQEPYVVKGRVAGLSACNGNVIYDVSSPKPRTCIYISKEVQYLPLWNYTSDDMTVVKLKHQEGGVSKELIVCSCYLPYEKPDPVSRELQNLVNHAEGERLDYILGVDANAHHAAWASRDTNNRGDKPTFITINRTEVLDITLASQGILRSISDWRVLDEIISLSDHRYISFNINNNIGPSTTYRNPKKTNWELFTKVLKRKMGDMKVEFRNSAELDATAHDFQCAVANTMKLCCPETKRPNTKQPTWWNNNLEGLRKKTRKLWNKAKRDGNRETFSMSLKTYSRELRKAKRNSWRSYCESIENVDAAARLQKIMARDPAFGIGNLVKPDGTYTKSGEETLTVLMATHYPEHRCATSNPSDNTVGVLKRIPSRHDWREATAIASETRIRAAVGTFKPYKSPGPDGIYPVMLQKGLDVIIHLLCKLFRSSLAMGYIPRSWRMARAVFLPKPGRKNLDQAKSYRPISLSSFLLKTLERLVDWRLGENLLSRHPHHPNQHAYQSGKSTESALSDLLEKIEPALKTQEIAMAAFLDIEGAFDNTSTDAIMESVAKADDTVKRWVEHFLLTRTIYAELFSCKKVILATRGCPQGGVLSPRLWNLVADGLLTELNELGFYTLGYADDFVIVVRGKDKTTLTELLQYALSIVERWCLRKGLRVNPLKTTLVPFTNKYKMGTLVAPMIFGEKIKIADHTKFLGIHLDKRLTWNQHVKSTTDKAKTTFNMVRRSVGKTWGLTPSITRWIYTSIVRPRITYASCIWWEKTEQSTVQGALESVQRSALLMISGAMNTAPTMALEVILGLPPLYIFTKGEAMMGSYRQMISHDGKLPARYKGLINEQTAIKADMPIDCMIPKTNLNYSYTTLIRPRSEWEGRGDERILKNAGIKYYTDGSRTNEGSGAGLCGPGFCRRSASLGLSSTVYQTEVFSIIMGARHALDLGWRDRKITFFSDSQAAIKTLTTTKVQSKLAWECIGTLNDLAASNQVHLEWIPGHRDIQGNETADKMARIGAGTKFIGPEPVLGLTKSTLKTRVKEWISDEANRTWNNSVGMRHSKLTLEGYSKKLTQEALALSRKQLRQVVSLLTGHGPFKKHLHTMGLCLEEPVECRLCGLEEETASHIIFECEALAPRRFRIFNTPNPENCFNLTSKPKDLLTLVKGLELWEVGD